jgi:antirestriction protein ArdC
MPSQNEIRQTITDQIIDALTAGTAPWRRPWISDPCAGSAKNAVSGKSYSGVNPLLLQIASERHGFQSRYWATYRQWSELGGQVTSRPSHVRPGEWGTQIVFCKPCRKTKRDRNGDEMEENYWMLRTYTVFCVDQVEGESVDRFRVGHNTASDGELDDRFQRADEAIEATGADIRYGGNQAFYQPEADFIQMPRRSQFAAPDFYDTLLHELTHWTEHASRLNWDRKLPENSYALGELIAELGACFLAGELGLPIEQSLGNHASYLQHWIGQMQGDARFIFRATSQATKAADFILSFSRQPAPEEEEVLVA